jgi:hypothetical protein
VELERLFMQPDWSRRALLASLGTVSLGSIAGCAGLTASGRGATDIILHNEAPNERTIDITVVNQGNDATEIDTGLKLDPHARHKINNKLLMGNDYEVTMTFSDESANISEYTETQEWIDAGKPLHVIINDQLVFATQIG